MPFLIVDGFSCISPENAAEIGIVEKMRHPLEVATYSRDHYVKIENTLRTDFYVVRRATKCFEKGARKSGVRFISYSQTRLNNADVTLR